MVYENANQYVQILKEWLPKEASVTIATEGAYTHYEPGIHDIGIEIGRPVQQGDLAKEVMVKKKKTERYIEESNYRASYYGIGYPITLAKKEAVVVIILPPFYQTTIIEPITFLTGRHDNSWCPVPVEDISYIESLQKKIWFYREDESYQSIYTLKELTNLLPKNFLRIHRSYIINIKQIAEISRDFSSNLIITLNNGDVLPVSQSYSVPVRKALGF